MYYAIYPIIFGSLSLNDGIHCVNARTVLLLLNQIINFIDYPPFLNAILGPLILEWIPEDCKKIIESPPINVTTNTGNYFKEWTPTNFKTELECIFDI